jgi:hypothetical protein
MKHFKLDNNVWLWLKLKISTRYDRWTMPSALPRHEALFAGVQNYVLFVGHPRSGHSVVGSTIDAHSNAFISHRLDSLKYLQAGQTLPEVFYLIYKNSQRFAKTQRKLTAYRYPVANGWQGRADKLQVIGDQEGRWTSLRLMDNTHQLREQLEPSNIGLRLINVVRNPYDNIATWSMRSGMSLQKSTETYFGFCRNVEAIRQQSSEHEFLRIYHERFVDDFPEQFHRIFQFLNMEADDDLLQGCQTMVYKKSHISRHKVKWNTVLLDRIATALAKYPYLSGYNFNREDFDG